MDPAIRLSVAVLADIVFGDPRFIPHPVKLLGAYITFCEIRIRRIFPKHEIIGGTFLTISTVALGYFMVFFSVRFAGFFGDHISQIVEIIWIYLGLSAGDLDRSVLRVFHALRSGNISVARERLSMIVGRDTKNLDEAEISRAGIETTAESLVDGLISPLFFLLLGGAPLMWAFKAINTCDSMIGHNDEGYHLFGRFSARLDDFANFVPARLSIPIIFLAAFFLRLLGEKRIHPLNCLKVCLRDMRKHASPNAGIPESAFAGALSVKLGGTNYYSGERYDVPIIGGEAKLASSDDIWNAVRLMWMSFLFAVLLIFFV